MKRCPKCTNLMPGDVTLCIRCGFDSKLTRAATVPKPPAARTAIPPAGPAKVGKIRNGFALAAQSWRVLMLDKQLLVFPLASGIVSFLVLASFIGGAVASGLGNPDAKANDALAWALLFAYYFASYFVIVFCNAALVACAMIRFRGGSPTAADGWRGARECLGQIVSWALLAATVGVVLRMIEERVGMIGKIVTALLGAGWTIATFFVVPVLVVEKVGPVDAAKRSVDIIRKAWGEALVSNLGVGLVSFLAVVLLVIPCGIAAAVAAVKAGSLTVALAGLAATLALLILIVLASSAMKSIILSAIYVYATEGKVPEAFEAENLQQVFVTR